MGWRLSQFDIQAQLAADRSSWITADDYPSTVLCRRILALADWAGSTRGQLVGCRPDGLSSLHWRVCRLAFECPELSIPEIGVALDLSEADVRRALAPADLSDQTDRDALACPLYDEPPAHLFPPAAKYDPDHVSATYANGTWLAMYAAARPVHWCVWRLRWAGLTQQEIADKVGISQKNVCEYLQQQIRFTKTVNEEEE